MDSDKSIMRTLPNGLFLAGSGVAVLIAKTLILSPVPRNLIAAAAILWGFYLLGKDRANPTPGWVSIGAGAALALLGGVLSAVSGVVGVGLIIAGGVSLVAGLFRKS
jgi:hypothetical protein